MTKIEVTEIFLRESTRILLGIKVLDKTLKVNDLVEFEGRLIRVMSIKYGGERHERAEKGREVDILAYVTRIKTRCQNSTTTRRTSS